MREKFMTTLTVEAKEKLKIISAKERRGMNTILEEMILNYYDPIEFKDYLFFFDSIDEDLKCTGAIKEKGGYTFMATDVIEKCIYWKKDKATIITHHKNGETVYIGTVYKTLVNNKTVWIADICNCPRLEFETIEKRKTKKLEDGKILVEKRSEE